MRKQIIKIYVSVLSVGIAYLIWGSITGKYLPCIYYQTTGLRCPGCGMSRMFLAMLRLDFISAFAYNPLMFTLFFYWNIIAILCFWERISIVKKPQFLYASLGVSVALFTIFAFLRNIY